ncbi:MAG: TonB-dependent receptor [candidate division WOR-3 bacterium]|nr:TonB-dependent receptor [candidate division WOR-3 bacterium]
MNHLQFFKLLITLFLVIPYLLNAQKSDSIDILVPKKSEYLTDTIIVTATRLPYSIFNMPQSALIISQNELIRRSRGDIQSALVGITGLDIRNYSFLNGASSISIWSGTSQQTLFLLDGIPINSPAVGMPDLGLFALGNLKRIEIVKGPVSSIYGANALAGVVNLITESPDEAFEYPKTSLRFQYGSLNTFIGDFQFTGGIKNYRYQLFGYQNKTNGLRTNDDLTTQGLSFNSTYTFSPQTKIRLDLFYSNKNLGTPGPLPDVSQNPPYGDSTCFSIYDRQVDTLTLIKSQLEFKLAPKFTIFIKGAHIINNTSYLWVNQYSPDTSLYNDYYQNRSSFLNLCNSYAPSSKLNLTWGIDLECKKIRVNTQLVNAKSENYGIFANITCSPRNVAIIGNFRFDYNSAFKNFTSFGLGLTKSLNRYLNFKVHWGSGFRAPTLSDLYWPNSGNISLKPECANTFQLSTELFINNESKLVITGFYRRTKNLISWMPVNNHLWQPVNIDSARVVGLELWGTKKIFKNLSFQFSTTLQNPTQIRKELVYYDFISGETRYEYKKRRQPYIPKVILFCELNYETNFNTSISLNARYVSDRVNYYQSFQQTPIITYDTKKLSSYFLLSLNISHEVLNKLTITLRLHNLLDTRYSEQFGNSIIDKNYPQPGRTIFMGITLKS